MKPPETVAKESQFWAELDGRFRAPLLAYFLRRVQDRAEAEDLTQEAFARLVRHADKPQGPGAQAYVFTIAANLLTDRARARLSRKVKEHRSLGDVLDGTAFAPELVEVQIGPSLMAATNRMPSIIYRRSPCAHA